MENQSRLPEGIERYRVALRRWRVEHAPELHALVLPMSITSDRSCIGPLSNRRVWTNAEHSLKAGACSGPPAATSPLESGARKTSSGRPGCIGESVPTGWRSATGLIVTTSVRVATAVSRALTDLAFTVPAVSRVQISHDASNLASAGIPARLGYQRLPDRSAVAPSGTASTGIAGVWMVTQDQWRRRSPSIEIA